MFINTKQPEFSDLFISYVAEASLLPTPRKKVTIPPRIVLPGVSSPARLDPSHQAPCGS
jgi:hypothetical protein